MFFVDEGDFVECAVVFDGEWGLVFGEDVEEVVDLVDAGGGSGGEVCCFVEGFSGGGGADFDGGGVDEDEFGVVV